MQVHFGLGALRPEWPASVVAIGTFDGVHLGHQAVIRTAVSQAAAQEIPAIVLTFDRHPASVLAPDRCPRALAALETNLAEFASLGVAATVVLAFDDALSQTPAEAFFREILQNGLRASGFVVGHDFAFGQHRQGTADWLAERLPTEIVPPLTIDGVRVSSSRIRSAIEQGQMVEATRWLGRPFSIHGVVIGGQKLGRTIGYPTVNLARSFDQVLPPDGVYATTARGLFGSYRAALSIGTRPAVGGRDRTIEAYLIDYPGDALYGQTVTLDLHHFLRAEANFPSLQHLTDQIARDVEAVRTSPVA